MVWGGFNENIWLIVFILVFINILMINFVNVYNLNGSVVLLIGWLVWM